MIKAKFYLKKPDPTTGRSLIYLQLKYNKKRLVWAFGQHISPKYWDKDNFRVLYNEETVNNELFRLNDLLDKIELNLNRIYFREISSGIPEPSVIKSNLNRMIKWGYIVDRIKGLNLDKKRRDDLKKAYLRRRLIRTGWPPEIIDENPVLLEIKKTSILTQRKIKIYDYPSI